MRFFFLLFFYAPLIKCSWFFCSTKNNSAIEPSATRRDFSTPEDVNITDRNVHESFVISMNAEAAEEEITALGSCGRRHSLSRSRSLSHNHSHHILSSKPSSVAPAQEDCSICWVGENTSYFLECGHSFHKECIMDWLKNEKTTCPLCRKDVIIPLKDSIALSSKKLVLNSLQLKEIPNEDIFNGCLWSIAMNDYHIFNEMLSRLVPNYRNIDIRMAIAKKHICDKKFISLFNSRNINDVDDHGNTALHYAAKTHSMLMNNMVELFVMDIDVNALNFQGKTPLDLEGLDCLTCGGKQGKNNFHEVLKLRGALCSAELKKPKTCFYVIPTGLIEWF